MYLLRTDQRSGVLFRSQTAAASELGERLEWCGPGTVRWTLDRLAGDLSNYKLRSTGLQPQRLGMAPMQLARGHLYRGARAREHLHVC